jgi:hypothetical protein
MTIDPFADPWATGMVVSLVFAGLSALMTLAAFLGQRSAMVERILLGVCMAAFLGSAVAGTVQRIVGDTEHDPPPRS